MGVGTDVTLRDAAGSRLRSELVLFLRVGVGMGAQVLEGDSCVGRGSQLRGGNVFAQEDIESVTAFPQCQLSP